MPVRQIDITTPNGTANAILAEPNGAARGGVLMIMDAFGLRPRIEQMAGRIAASGYAVLAPNVFYRAGRDPVGPMPDLSTPEARGKLFGTLRPLMDALTPEAVARDGRAYLDGLAEVAAPPFAVTGYCMGVRVALIVAAEEGERVAAVGGFHGGRLVTDGPDSPHRLAPRLRAEVYLGHADHDESMTPAQIAELERTFAEAGVTLRSELYTDAAHGYTMSDTPAYDEAAAERHFTALFDLLERTLPVPL